MSGFQPPPNHFGGCSFVWFSRKKANQTFFKVPETHRNIKTNISMHKEAQEDTQKMYFKAYLRHGLKLTCSF